MANRVPFHRCQRSTRSVREIKPRPATLLIEHNGLALHREEWISRALREGDKIEFIRVVTALSRVQFEASSVADARS